MFELAVCTLAALQLRTTARQLGRSGHWAWLAPASMLAGGGVGQLLGRGFELDTVPLYIATLVLGGVGLIVAHVIVRGLAPGPDADEPPPLPSGSPLDGLAQRRRRTAWLFLRGLGLVYLLAFASIATQIHGLVGEQGILPASDTFEAIGERYGSAAWWHTPSLALWSASDASLTAMCVGGLVLAALLIADVFPLLCLIGLYVLYLSVLHACQNFLWFQWDTLLLEAGFAAIFLAPWNLRPHWREPPAPTTAGLITLMWLLARLILGAGICKLASEDPTWADLTAMRFHFLTQPLPNVVGYLAYHLPGPVLDLATAQTFAIELLAPVLLLLPGRYRHLGAASIAGLMGMIALTGNYGFFNLLTAALCLVAIDDDALPRWARPADSPITPPTRAATGRGALAWIVAAALLPLGLLHLTGAWSRGERAESLVAVSNAVNPFHVSNTYGLFARMTLDRPELILEGSNDGETWRAYELPYKAGALDTALPLAGPHMPRLDWMLWFAALGDLRHNRWVLGLVFRLLDGSPEVLALLDDNPFPDHPPRWVRITRYDYTFTPVATWWATGQSWQGGEPTAWMPPLSLEMFEPP